MNDPGVLEQMRADWNRRAREDANYYVAFGRRDQSDDEFYSTAADILRDSQRVLRRIPAALRGKALEIGCGPGRLMRPMAGCFDEVHGVDVSDEMVHLAERKLRDVPNAYPRKTDGADLSMYPDSAFDLVYSYAVFQHIPSSDVVFAYLQEARRVLKDGGYLWCQINGLPQAAAQYTTWEGVRISAAAAAGFARENDLQLLALEGALTQYMWITCRKRAAGWARSLRALPPPAAVRVRDVTNAITGEPAIPASGPFAVISLWAENLPADLDLNHMQVLVDGRPATPNTIEHPRWDGLTQLNAALPEGVRTGLVPVQVSWLGRPLVPTCWARLMEAGPLIPRIVSIGDGMNLLSGMRIVSGAMKIVMQDVDFPDAIAVDFDGAPVETLDRFRADPRTARYEINFRLPAGTRGGTHAIRIRAGRRNFPPVAIEVA